MTDNELIAQLCIRIGMIMEDVCGDAVTARADRAVDLGPVLCRLREASDRISALVRAAEMLAMKP
ncbi:hypothetical protein H7F51_18260 [Novosphingobium flavum]|uniref:Uncharacterized protein n=1 Tax=Novosphingobium flavum TaxID=1778672 RepID=A0A7X1KN97_9SPHN|nr:hypothetical protein [Novosphingobium flavum]MBC2667466.1 hypothetical protein [Novosphingobium flavum]